MVLPLGRGNQNKNHPTSVKTFMKTLFGRKSTFHVAASGFAVLAFSSIGTAWAEDGYPSKPVTIVVPYAAGGTSDLVARAFQQPLSDALGQTIVIDNRAGAAGVIGVNAVVDAKPDGYTLLLGNCGPNSLVPLTRKVSYDPVADLQPISTAIMTPMILAVPENSPAKDLKGFLSEARKQSNWTYGSTGLGGLSHLTGEYFNDLAGTDLMHIPHKGGAPIMASFAGGRLDAAFITGLDGASLHEAGRIRYLAVGTLEPTPVLPDVPVIADELPGFNSVCWFGFLAPKGLPDDVASTLNDAIRTAVNTPEVQQLFTERNVEPRASSPEELADMIQNELQQWGEVVREAGIKTN